MSESVTGSMAAGPLTVTYTEPIPMPPSPAWPERGLEAVHFPLGVRRRHKDAVEGVGRGGHENFGRAAGKRGRFLGRSGDRVREVVDVVLELLDRARGIGAGL